MLFDSVLAEALKGGDDDDELSFGKISSDSASSTASEFHVANLAGTAAPVPATSSMCTVASKPVTATNFFSTRFVPSGSVRTVAQAFRIRFNVAGGSLPDSLE